MNDVIETIAPLDRPTWLLWLRRELAPFPGRGTMTLRLVVSVVAVMIISMTLETPLTAISAYFVFFVTKENRVVTTTAGIGLAVGGTIAVALSLFFYRYTFDYPELRLPVMAATVFGGMFLSRVLVIGPVAFAIGFLLSYSQCLAESAPDADALVRRAALAVGGCYLSCRDHRNCESNSLPRRPQIPEPCEGKQGLIRA